MNAPTITELVSDPQLLALSLSAAQQTLLKAIYGLPLDAEELALWAQCTGRPSPPTAPFQEVTVLAGARAGKDSRVGAPIAIFEAAFGGHERHLAPGERATVVLVAQDHRATKVALGYIRDGLERSPLLRAMVAEIRAQEIELATGVVVSCFPCTTSSLRGWSIPVAVLDEVGFWRLEGSSDSDVEVQASVRRGMVNFARTKLVKISTPYMKSGVLYEDFTRSFGQDDADVLVWKASSVLMNPSLQAERLERERRLDPVRYAREYEAEFAEDIDCFLPGAWIDGAVVPGRRELPPREGVRYLAACDCAGGGPDSSALSLVHLEGQDARRRVVQDVMRAWGRARAVGVTVDLEGCVQEMARICRNYGCQSIFGDRYAAGWVREAFRRAGLRYREPELGETYLDKSLAYTEAEPLFATGQVELLDHPQLVRELKLLERRPQAGGRVRVDHPSGGHDDLANALALAVALASRGMPRPSAGAALPPGALHAGEPLRSGTFGAARGNTGQAGQMDRGYAGGPAAGFGIRRYGRW